MKVQKMIPAVGKMRILQLQMIEEESWGFQWMDGQWSEVEEWMVDFIVKRLRWMMMMKESHYRNLSETFLLSSL